MVFSVGQLNYAKFGSDNPCCHGNENLEMLTENLPQLWLYIRQSRNFWFYGMVYGDGLLNYASARTDPCCHGNENLNFLQKICHNET